MPNDWSSRVRQHARWLKRDLERGTQLDEIVEELAAWMDEEGLVGERGYPPRSTVGRWTKGIQPRGDDWSFEDATPSEVRLVTKVYDSGRKRGDDDAWPSAGEADWWVKVQTVLPRFPAQNVYPIGRYAAAGRGRRAPGACAEPHGLRREPWRSPVHGRRHAVREARRSGRSHGSTGLSRALAYPFAYPLPRATKGVRGVTPAHYYKRESVQAFTAAIYMALTWAAGMRPRPAAMLSA